MFQAVDSDSLSGFYDRYPSAAAGKGKLNIPQGEIVLGPLKKDDGSPNDDMDVVLHELGHACSFIQRAFEVQAGDPSAYEEFKNRDVVDSDCSLAHGLQLVYQALFAKLGFNTETLSCAMENSAQATHQRFTSGSCSKGCPESAIEEHFADLVSYWLLEQKDAARAMRKLCTYARDAQHPLMSDVIGCATKTPKFAQRFKNWMGCQ